MLLTSHYMADVTALCKRVVVIHHGKLLFDGQLDALASRLRLPDQFNPVDLQHADVVRLVIEVGVPDIKWRRHASTLELDVSPVN